MLMALVEQTAAVFLLSLPLVASFMLSYSTSHTLGSSLSIFMPFNTAILTPPTLIFAVFFPQFVFTIYQMEIDILDLTYLPQALLLWKLTSYQETNNSNWAGPQISNSRSDVVNVVLYVFCVTGI